MHSGGVRAEGAHIPAILPAAARQGRHEGAAQTGDAMVRIIATEWAPVFAEKQTDAEEADSGALMEANGRGAGSGRVALMTLSLRWRARPSAPRTRQCGVHRAGRGGGAYGPSPSRPLLRFGRRGYASARGQRLPCCLPPRWAGGERGGAVSWACALRPPPFS